MLLKAPEATLSIKERLCQTKLAPVDKQQWLLSGVRVTSDCDRRHRVPFLLTLVALRRFWLWASESERASLDLVPQKNSYPRLSRSKPITSITLHSCRHNLYVDGKDSILFSDPIVDCSLNCDSRESNPQPRSHQCGMVTQCLPCAQARSSCRSAWMD